VIFFWIGSAISFARVAWSTTLRCYRMANRLRLERRGLISAVRDVVSNESVDKLTLFSLLQGGQKVMRI
jgi:hypothetical protein